ncbi:MAG: glycosyltransferase family 2 protein [Bacteroidales bacterium]|jgi:hypothetical protein
MEINLASVVKSLRESDFECWLKYHVSLGFNNIFIIDNDSPEWVKNICLKYKNVIYLKYSGKMNWPLQSKLLKDLAIKFSSKKETWFSFIDDDEFLYFTNGNNPKEWLNDKIIKYPNCNQFSLYWKFLGAENGIKERELQENFIDAFRYSNYEFKIDKNGQSCWIKSFIKFTPNMINTQEDPHMIYKESIDCLGNVLTEKNSPYINLVNHDAYCYHCYYLSEKEFNDKWYSKYVMSLCVVKKPWDYNKQDWNWYSKKDDNLYDYYHKLS